MTSALRRIARARAALVVALTLAGCAPPLTPGAAPAPASAPVSKPAPTTPAPAPAASTPAPAATPASPNAEPSLASDAVAESLLVDLASVDTTIRVEMRYATPYNFTGAVLPGYTAPRALLRREAAEALGRVQARLRAEGGGLGLKIFDAYRPVRATEAMVAWTHRVGREDLLRDGYIAERSRHNLGLAVDLTLVELPTGRELKMGTAFDTFAASAHTANATGDVAANRQRLVRAMQAEGFTNLPEEWWHFSYQVPNPMRFDLVIR
jgi:D-alanyl-D-alanine dipeptidase